jgi:hypothetical protein
MLVHYIPALHESMIEFYNLSKNYACFGGEMYKTCVHHIKIYNFHLKKWNIASSLVALLLHIQEIIGLNLSPETHYPDMFFVVLHSPFQQVMA